MATVRKLVDRVDIIRDLDQNVTPKYFPDTALDKNRVSVYGYLTEALATSIEDTIALEQRRATDYCAELSSSEIHVNQTAKIRGIGANRATPGRCYAFLGVLKSDILKRGVKWSNDEIRFTIDRRSTILYGGINFSLEDDIIVRAIRRGADRWLFSANYTGEHATYDSFVMTYEYVNTNGEELVAMIVQLFQMKHNIAELHVTDEIEFTYDGLFFPYDNQLAGFDVYYKLSANDTFTKASLDHYLTMQPAETKCLYYNDDETGILRIMNNPYLNVGINSIVRAEIRETLGTEGNNITVNGTDKPTFEMYQDAAYNYAGVYVFISILTDVQGGTDGDDLVTLKKRLIDAKTRRDNLTTDHDIISYINDRDANVQLEKKRNDIQDRRYYMYTLVRHGDRRLAPTTTKRLELVGMKRGNVYSFQDVDDETKIYSPEDYYLQDPKSPNRLFPLVTHQLQDVATGETSEISPFGDFDYYDPITDRKIIRAYSKFRLNVVPTAEGDEAYPDGDYVTKIPMTTREISVASDLERSRLTAGDGDDQVMNGDIVRVLKTNGLDVEVDSATYDVVDATKLGTADWEQAFERSYYLTCPYLMVIDNLNFCRYYFNSVDHAVNLSMATDSTLFPYQMICRQIHIHRDAHDPDVHDVYTFTVKASMNTENDSLLVNLDESDDNYLEILDDSRVVCCVLLPVNGSTAAYIPMKMNSYNPKTREFAFTGTLRTDDFITETDKLHVVSGPKTIATGDPFDGTVDYTNGFLQVAFLYRLCDVSTDEDGNRTLTPIEGETINIADYPRDSAIYSLLSPEDLAGYVHMNTYYNNSSNPYHLILEFDKFSRSPTTVKLLGDDTYGYSIGEVPFFEYTFGQANTAKLYDTFKNMADVYGSMLKQTTDFEVSLKFIATYGPSKYLYVHGGRFEWSYEASGSFESTDPLYDLNPTLFFKVYGFGAPVEEIYRDIYEYLRDSYNTDDEVFMSNICTAIEEKYSSVRSIKFMGINSYDGSYQHLIFRKPEFTDARMINRYVPEQINITDIRIELDESMV